jgi:hypothetical protein
MSATVQDTRLLRTSGLFRTVWGAGAAKQAARASGMSVRTAQAWMAERCSPSADTLLRMAARNEELRAELARLLQQGSADEATVGDVVAAAPRAGAAAAGPPARPRETRR